jgi:hypothetical protein
MMAESYFRAMTLGSTLLGIGRSSEVPQARRLMVGGLL